MLCLLMKNLTLFFFNIPFVRGSNLVSGNVSLVDKQYETFSKYVSQGKNFLREGGRQYIMFSPDIGDEDSFNLILKKYDAEVSAVGVYRLFDLARVVIYLLQ